ncbi:MAG: hypothetical protein LBI37_03485 [Puniceicoccales bacterium]|jgi:hypothetical protein|nr:hypothetical protein [Puniceicoccales bacterium]
MNRTKNYLTFFLGSAVILLSGCRSIGPGSIKEVHPKYNYALAETVNEQMLLNLVRLKYRDTPYFLEVSGITESRTLKASAGLGKTQWNVNAHNSGPTAVMAFPMLGAEENISPTITYSPLQGDKFVKNLVDPISLEVVLMMVQAGWSINRVFDLCVERINSLDNASSASGPTPDIKPNYEDFFQATELLTTLADHGKISIGVTEDRQLGLGISRPGEPVLKFLQKTKNSEERSKLNKLLDLAEDLDEFRIRNNCIDQVDHILALRTRSIMEVLFYLSHAIEVPDEDIDAGLVTSTSDENGEIFDWANNMSGQWLRIHCSDEKPTGAFVSIKYRGSWFHINDNDLNSKSTFMLLGYLFNLQSGNSTRTTAPVLTLPVGN